jgi:hypothetical protein
MELYGIEHTSIYPWGGGNQYRWYSKYNGARGPWCYNKEEAISGGKEHSDIIRALFAGGSEQAIAQQINGGAKPKS